MMLVQMMQVTFKPRLCETGVHSPFFPLHMALKAMHFGTLEGKTQMEKG